MDICINGVKHNNDTYYGSATAINYSNAASFGVAGTVFYNQYFNGKTDDFRTYNHVLSATAISSLYSFQP